MKLIADWTTKQHRCHICGTTKSVKYLMTVYDPIVDDKPVEVTVCNKCALAHADAKAKSEGTYPYIINAGDALDNLFPYLACESKEKAIDLCKNNTFYKYLEVVYMPEDDLDTNDVVWRSWKD